MKTLGFSMVFLLVVHLSSMAQENIKPQGKNVPHENVTVNKKYDDKGNLVQYDSVYTYSYNNESIDSTDIQSIISKFPGFFNHNMEHFIPQNFVQNDSLFFKDFFNDDFFENGFVNQDQNLMELMQRMDSIKNVFFDKNKYL